MITKIDIAPYGENKFKIIKDKINEIIDHLNEQEQSVVARETGTVFPIESPPPVELSRYNVPERCYKAWLLAYEDSGWVQMEMKKAVAWIEANPRKRPKKFERFMTNWLSRAWEQYRKTIPSNTPSSPNAFRSTAELMGEK